MANKVNPSSRESSIPPEATHITDEKHIWIPRAGEPGKAIKWERAERKQKRKFYESGRREETLQSIENILKKGSIHETDITAINQVLEKIRERGRAAITKKGRFFKEARKNSLDKKIDDLKVRAANLFKNNLVKSINSDINQIKLTIKDTHITNYSSLKNQDSKSLYETVYHQTICNIERSAISEGPQIAQIAQELQKLYNAKVDALQVLDDSLVNKKFTKKTTQNIYAQIKEAFKEKIETSDNIDDITQATKLFNAQLEALAAMDLPLEEINKSLRPEIFTTFTNIHEKLINIFSTTILQETSVDTLRSKKEAFTTNIQQLNEAIKSSNEIPQLFNHPENMRVPNFEMKKRAVDYICSLLQSSEKQLQQQNADIVSIVTNLSKRITWIQEGLEKFDIAIEKKDTALQKIINDKIEDFLYKDYTSEYVDPLNGSLYDNIQKSTSDPKKQEEANERILQLLATPWDTTPPQQS